MEKNKLRLFIASLILLIGSTSARADHMRVSSFFPCLTLLSQLDLSQQSFLARQMAIEAQRAARKRPYDRHDAIQFLFPHLQGGGISRALLRQQIVQLMPTDISALPRDEARNSVLIIGSGPNGLAAALGVREEGLNPIIVEQADLPAPTFFRPRGAFWINSPELEDASSNEIPNALLHMRDLTDLRFATSEDLGDMLAINDFLVADTYLRTRVDQIQWHPTADIYQVTFGDGTVRPFAGVIYAPGLGKPSIGLKDSDSVAAIQAIRQNSTGQLVAPKFEVFDDIAERAAKMILAKETFIQAYAGKDVVIYGDGDAANVMAEVFGGYGPKPLYNAHNSDYGTLGEKHGPGIGEMGGVRSLTWIHQRAENIDDFKARNKRRYDLTIPKFFEQIIRKEERVAKVYPSERRFTHQLEHATNISGPYDYGIFCTGYESTVRDFLSRVDLKPHSNSSDHLSRVEGHVRYYPSYSVIVGLTPEARTHFRFGIVGAAAGDITQKDELDRTITKNAHSINALAERSFEMGKTVTHHILLERQRRAW